MGPMRPLQRPSIARLALAAFLAAACLGASCGGDAVTTPATSPKPLSLGVSLVWQSPPIDGFVKGFWIAVNPSGETFISNFNQVVKLDAFGHPSVAFGSGGTGPGQNQGL